MIALLGAASIVGALAGESRPLSPAERSRLAAHGPWPAEVARDPSNRVSGDADAIAFGELLFHSARLSTVDGLRCSSCHEPWRSFADGRPRAVGAEPGSRNTTSLYNVALNRWFGWDGANDSLWAQSVRPMLDPREMRSSAAQVATALRTDATLADLYAKAFGSAPAADDEALLVDIGKALAAYQETLLSERTAFDAYRDAVLRGNARAAAAYPASARRGLGVFEGRGGCAACHSGATFSDGEFHRSFVVSVLPGGEADSGREVGIVKLLANPHNRLGRFGDGSADRARAAPTLHAASEVDRAGAFRTPGLREVATTGPYMHDGSVENLCDAVGPHALPALGAAALPLSRSERNDVVAFLQSLSTRTASPLLDPAIYRCQ